MQWHSIRADWDINIHRTPVYQTFWYRAVSTTNKNIDLRWSVLQCCNKSAFWWRNLHKLIRVRHSDAAPPWMFAPFLAHGYLTENVMHMSGTWCHHVIRHSILPLCTFVFSWLYYHWFHSGPQSQTFADSKLLSCCCHAKEMQKRCVSCQNVPQARLCTFFSVNEGSGSHLLNNSGHGCRQTSRKRWTISREQRWDIIKRSNSRTSLLSGCRSQSRLCAVLAHHIPI